MNTYNDIYEPFNWTRFILLLVLLCVTVFYYSTQAFIVEASDENPEKHCKIHEVC